MKVSVIIPTYNGEKKIPNILQSLANQTFTDFETVVVIDGSKDNTEKILAENHFGLKNLKVISQKNGGRSVSRNSGAKEAKGELLIFFDDDMRPTPPCLESHIKHHQTFPQSILVGNQIEDLSALTTDIQRYKAFLSRKWAIDINSNSEKKIDKNRPFITAANFSISKKTFFELGLFDENLTDAEDFDLAVRASITNIDIYFDPAIVAWHDDFITCRTYIKRTREYKKSHERLKELKPDLYQKFNQYEYNSIGILKKTIYWLFSQSFWIITIDNFNWLKLFPQKIRYKIYDLIITGLGVYFPQKKI